jgi:hypothetical protein
MHVSSLRVSQQENATMNLMWHWVAQTQGSYLFEKQQHCRCQTLDLAVIYSVNLHHQTGGFSLPAKGSCQHSFLNFFIPSSASLPLRLFLFRFSKTNGASASINIGQRVHKATSLSSLTHGILREISHFFPPFKCCSRSF